MFVAFESLLPTSRIWIYQSDKKFSEKCKSIIDQALTQFSENWAAHGQDLKSSFDIRYDQFVILATDESYNAASGCSIDNSVRAIKELETFTGLNFFSRNQIAFLKNDNVLLLELAELKQKYQTGMWNSTTLAFNNLINTKSQLEKEWIMPAGEMWLKRYVPTETLTT